MLCEPCSALGINGSPPSGCNKTKEERCCCMASRMIDILVKRVSHDIISAVARQV